MQLKFNLGSAGLKQKTIRDFSGGLNTQDSPWNTGSHYASVLKNLSVGEDGSLSTRVPFISFTNANASIGSSQSTSSISDWGVYNEPIVLGASPTITATDTSSWINIDFDAPHGLVTGNWIKGITNVAVGSLGGVPYVEFNDAQWRCVKRIDDTTVAVRVDTEATSTESVVLSTETRFCNKVALMLPQGDGVNEQTLGFVDGWYFNNNLICVDRVGVVFAIDGEGGISIIFNDIIAADISGAPRGWRPLCDNGELIDVVTAAPFKGTLSINNGLDKPLEVYDDAGTIKCRYLTDAGTGLNTYVPIGAYCTVNNQYVCIAGQPLQPSAVSISAKGTNGTFLGAPDPNDAIELFIDEYSESDTGRITGIGTYRGRLLVFTPNSVLVFQLGTYVEDVHQPQYIETIYDVGTRSPRSLAKLSDDLLLVDEAGITGIRQTRISNTLEIGRYSDVIRNVLLELLDNSNNVSLYSEVFARVDRKNRALLTHLLRAAGKIEINTAAIIYQEANSAVCRIELQAPTNLVAGDTITLYDFEDQNGVSLSGGADNYRRYTITNVSEDRLKVFFEARTVADDFGVYVPAVGYGAQVIVSNDEDSFVREQKSAILAMRNIASTKTLSWYSLSGLDRFGSIRGIAVSELNNVFLILDYAILVMAPQSSTAFYDFDSFVGQNVHNNFYTIGGVRRYHADFPVFNPATASAVVYPPEHSIITDPGTLEDDITASGQTWATFLGKPIEFEYVSPWIDFNNRRSEKRCRFLALDTEGTGILRVQAFADGIYKDDDGQLLPIIDMSFWAGGVKYHTVPRVYNSLYEIAENSLIYDSTLISETILAEQAVNGYASNQQLHPFDVTFRTIRFRIFGDTTYGPVRLVGISLFLAEGALVGA